MSRSTHGGGGRSTLAMPKHARSNSAGSTVLVNLDVYVVRATIGRDISADDDDLIVLFRRNSKEVTSEPTRWHPDHIAEWNQHVGIQTSLLRNKQAVDPTDYLSKDYEIVLVALPSHSAVALFTIDFAQIVQSQRANRPKPFRVSPTKCRDLAATLEFEVVWEYASPPPPLAPLTPTSSSVATTATTTSSSSLSMAGRRTNVSVVSMSSQNSELPLDGVCGDCRSLRRRLERKDMQILQLENFLKESQKRIDSLVFENEELVVRETAETKNAAQYRALNMRLLQELEMAFQFCAQQMLQVQQQAQASGVAAPPQLFMFLPQFEFMERVKKFHHDLELIYGGSSVDGLHDSAVGKPAAASSSSTDPWSTFDFREEMESALERNQRLQHQLEFLARSLVYDGHSDDHGAGTVTGMPPNFDMRRKATNTSSASDFSLTELATHTAHEDLSASRVAPVRTVTEQLNALERENFLLKAKLESAMNNAKSYHNGRSGSSPSECAETMTTGSSLSRNSLVSASLSLLPAVPDDATLRLEVDQLRDEKLALARELADLKADLETAKRDQLQNERESNMTPPPPLTVGVVAVSASASASPVDRPSTPVSALNSSQVSSRSGGSATSPAGSDFLNKIYMDVGKAKVALEEKVKRLTQELMAAQDANERLEEQLKQTLHKSNSGGYDTSDGDVLSQESDTDEPKIVEILSDEDEEEQLHRASPHPTVRSDDVDFAAERAQLEAQIQQQQQVIEDKTSQLKVQEQELQFMKQHLTEKAAMVTDMEAANVEVQKELDTTKQCLTKAQKKITGLEIKIETMEVEHKQQRDAQEQRAVVTKSQSSRDDDHAELTKQLKLARQEVMQLRYRSNNLESVHEKLEEALKEKKTLQVKLTALEGQLYEQRSRTISDNNFSTEGIRDAAMIEELHRQLEQKAAQLMIAQREVDTLRRELTTDAQKTAVAATAAAAASTQSSLDIAELETKVAKFAAEIARLGERNDEQALRINALSERVEKTTREKYELEGIMKEMLKEMDGLSSSSSSAPSSPVAGTDGRTASSGYQSAPASYHQAGEQEESEGKQPVIPVAVRSPGNKVVERYANALKSTFERRGSAPRPPAPPPCPPYGMATDSSGEAVYSYTEEPPVAGKSKVAHLIKNFSAEDVDVVHSPVTMKPRRSTLTGSIKKITKMDFRNRQGSGASS